MSSNYFLGAQLPWLVYEQSIPMSSVDFLALVKDKMSSKDSSLLEQCALSGVIKTGIKTESDAKGKKKEKKPSSDFIKHWNKWESDLKLALASGRAKKLKRDEGEAEHDGRMNDAEITAKQALAMESPLEAEIFLDKARWNAIDSFQKGSIFSENAMCAYFLKLLLMERKALFNTEEGFTEYKGLYAAILGEAK